MSYVVVTDPKTGEKYLDFKKGGGQPKAKEDKASPGLGLQPTDLFPTVGVPLQAFQTAVKGVTAGVQEFQKSGDFGKALTAGQKKAVQSLEGSGPLQTIGRIGSNAGRNALQEISDVVTADVPAMFGAAQPTTKDRPDAPFLGVMPPLPKAKSSGPAEDLVTGIAQVAIEWFPAFKAVGLAGKAAKAVPGVTKATQGAGAAVDALKGTKAAQALAKVPGAKAVGGALASNTLTKGAATGALIDVTGFDQHEGRLYDLVDKLQQQVTGTPLEVPVLSYLRSDPNDVGMAGRLKNALEGAGLGTAVESIFKIIRTAKYVNQARQAPVEAKPEAIAKVQEVADDLENTMVREATQVQEPTLRTEPTVLPEAEGRIEPTMAPVAQAAELPTKIFHGTTEANAAAIQQGGFQASGMRGDVGNALGDGVFFTSNPQYAADYGPKVLEGDTAAAGIRLKTLSNDQYEELIDSKYGGFDENMFPKDQQALIKEFGGEFDGVRVTEGFGGPGNNIGDEIVVFDPKKADALINPQAAAPAAKAELPDTRGQGEFFHGAAREIDRLDEGYYENANIYGQGFYVTDDLKTAGSYTKKNTKAVAKGGGTPIQVIYRVTEGQPVNFYDLDAPVAPSVREYLEQASEWSEATARALDEMDADPGISLAKVMDEIRANSRNAGESRDTIQEVFEGLRETLEGEGYGGFTHVGGKLTKTGRKHQVRIYWDARNQLNLEKYDPGALAPAATAPSKASRIAELGPEPQRPTPPEPDQVAPSESSIPASASRKINPNRLESAAESLFSWVNDSTPGGQQLVKSVDEAVALIESKGRVLDPDAIPGLDMDAARSDKTMGRTTPNTEAVARAYAEFYGLGGTRQVEARINPAKQAAYEAELKAYEDYQAKRQAIESAPEPSVPSAGSSAPAAGPTPQEIQELDQALAMGRADLSPEQRVALRDQVLAQKYGTGSPVEPPAAAMEAPATAADGGDLPPIPPPEPPVAVSSPLPDDNWANKLVTEIQQQNEQLADGSITLDDLLENNVQKIQSPSGATQYVAVQPDMVQAYRAFADTFSRPEVTGIEAMNFDKVRSYARGWLEANGYNGDAIINNLAPLSGALADAEQNVRALHLSGLYVDYTNKQAGIAANQFLNGKANGGANIAQLTEELLVAAAAQKRANIAFESVTRPIGQLLASTQIPRNLDDAVPGQVMPDPIPSGKDIAGEMEEALAKEQDVPVADSIGMPISEETRQAIITGVYTPQAMADLDALAQNMAQAAVTPGFARGFWDNFNKSVEIGARGLVMYRSAQLLSSGLTFWRNTINNTVRSLQLPLSQALGAAAQLEFSRAGQSLQLYGQYVSNLQNSFRLATESFKVGRGLFDLDSTSVDFLDRLATQDAAGNAGKLGADAKGEWTLDTLPWVDVQDKTVWGMAQKRLWQALNLSTRLQVSADTFFKSMVGQSFEYVRNLQPGLDHAIQMGMTPGSKEAWGFAEDYARAAVDKSLRDVTINGKTILDGVMESPHAQTAMRYATFTDDIWAQMQPRTMSYGMDLAAAKGLEGEAAQQYAMEYVQKGSSDVPVFSKTFSLMPGAWQKLIDLSPLFSIVQPFNRTPGDLVKSAARSTPLAPLVDTWWRDINSEDAFTRDRALGDIAIGMGAVSLASLAMTHGRIEFTGGGPVEPTARRKWRDEGKQPYSFRMRIGEDANGNPLFGEWVPMQVFEPISNLMGALGDYQEIANKLPVEVRERLGSSIVIDLLTAVAAGQMSKTYYQGFMELYEAAMGIGEMDPGPNKRNPAMRYISRVAAGMVPYSSSLRAGRRYADNELREVPASDKAFPMSLFEETLGEIKNMVPGWSTSLPPRLNWITGEPQVLTGVYGDQFIPPDQPWLSMLFQLSPGAVFRGGPKQTDPVMLEMAQLSGRGAAFMGPRNTDFGRELRLNPFQMNDYVTSVSTTRDQFGRTLREALLEEISSPRYQELPGDEVSTQVMGNRAASLNMVIQGFMKLGKEDFLSKHPEIRDSMLNVEGRNRDVQFRLKYGQPVDVPTFIEGLR